MKLSDYQPLIKSDDAPSVFVIDWYNGYVEFETYYEAEEWAEREMCGTVFIEEKTWCHRCKNYTEKVCINHKWVSDCDYCDRAYITIIQTQYEKLAAWNAAMEA